MNKTIGISDAIKTCDAARFLSQMRYINEIRSPRIGMKKPIIQQNPTAHPMLSVNAFLLSAISVDFVAHPQCIHTIALSLISFPHSLQNIIFLVCL